MKTDFIQIASYASKAPSGHNTQPWKFHITDSTITVLPNLDVALPVVDRNNRELFISLGCAVENLCIPSPRTSFCKPRTAGKSATAVFLAAPHSSSSIILQDYKRNPSRNTNQVTWE